MRIPTACFVLGAWSAIAAAEPTVTSTPAQPSSYVGAGVVAGAAYNGASSGVEYGAFELDGGIRLGSSRVWAHGFFAQGGIRDLDGGGGSSDYLSARIGFEAPVCTPHSRACLLVGVDVGLRHQRLMATELDATDAVVVQRGGIDFGTAHFRVRPSAEFVFGITGFALGLSLASTYEW